MSFVTKLKTWFKPHALAAPSHLSFPHLPVKALNEVLPQFNLGSEKNHSSSQCIFAQRLREWCEPALSAAALEAHIECLPHWTYSCSSEPTKGRVSISHGFLIAMYQLAALVVLRRRQLLLDPKNRAPELSQFFSLLLKACATLEEIPKFVTPSADLNENERAEVGFLTRWLETYAICHELGHLVTAKAPADDPILERARTLVRQYAAATTIKPDSSDYLESWAEEVACDLRAVELSGATLHNLFDKAPEDPQLLDQLSQGPGAGATLFLMLQASLEDFMATATSCGRSQLYLSHPPALIRWKILMEIPEWQGNWNLANNLMVLTGLLRSK